MTARVLLADDYEMFLEGLKVLLDQVPGIELVGTARDGAAAVEQAELFRPDVVLMDMTMPQLNGIQAAQQIRARLPDTKILVLSMHNDKNLIVESLRTAACGYVLKECSSQELCLAIQTAMNGQNYLTPSVEIFINLIRQNTGKSLRSVGSFFLPKKRGVQSTSRNHRIRKCYFPHFVI